MSTRSGIRDNRSRGEVHEFIRDRAVADSRLSVVSAYFTAFAYDRLRVTLDQVGQVRFLFGEPRFLKDADNAGLVPPAFSLGESGLRLTDQVRHRAAALRCAQWIKDRVEIRSVKRSGLLHGKLIHVNDGRREHALVGSSNFTMNGLGLGNSSNIELNLIVDSDRDRADLLTWFDELWSDASLTEDVRQEVLRTLEANYAHAAPEFVYFKTLLHLFGDFLIDQAAEDALIKQTAFEQTAIWRTLFDFQRDGLRAVLAKIEKHGGCVLADSVGLGKTFTALAVIKWFEKRNKNVLVLCPKKLRENWTDYLATNNGEMNPLREDRFGYTVLSHTDRHWFEVVRAAIPTERWTCHEMYEMVALSGEASPYLRPVSPDVVMATIEQARAFIAQKHLPAAANYARSACELLLRKQCEKRKIAFPYNPDPKKIMFEQLKKGLEEKLAGDQPKRDALASITPHQARILNPLSHDPTTSLNEAEVVAAIDAVVTLMTELRKP